MVCGGVRGAGPRAVVSGEVLELAAEFRMDGPGGRDGAGGGWLRNPQCLDAVAPDAVVYAERQFVAVGVVGQSIELERTTVAGGWPAGFVRESVYRLGWATVHLEWPAGFCRRRTGFRIGK